MVEGTTGAGIGRAALLLLAALLPACNMAIENDLFTVGEGTDQNYTAGLRFQADLLLDPAAPEDDMGERDTMNPGFTRDVAEALDLWPLDPDPHQRLRPTQVSLALGQAIFTPEDIRVERLITDDRPYAGWLYTALVRTETVLDRDDLRRDDAQTAVELQAGLVGPYSFAEDAQKLVHELVNSPDPKGWDNQLDTEPGLLLRLTRRDRPFYRQGLLCGDMVTSWGGSIGNVRTWAEASAILRVGRGLPRDFGPDLAEAGSPGRSDADELAVYAFFGGGGRYVLRDIFLDGNSFSNDSHTVPKEHWVGDLRAGLVLQWPGFAISWTQVRRSREFSRQDRPHNFGSLVFTGVRRF